MSDKRAALPNGKELAQIKRAKYEHKQKLLAAQQACCCSAGNNNVVVKNKVDLEVERLCANHGDFLCLYGNDSLNEVLLAPYKDLKIHQQQNNNKKKNDRLFVGEGTETVRVLLKQHLKGLVEIESILVKPVSLVEEPVKLWDDILKIFLEYKNNDSPRLRKRKEGMFRVIVATQSQMSNLAGFQIARGAMVACKIPELNEKYFIENLNARKRGPVRIAILDEVGDDSNMGSIIRSAACLGIDFIVLHNCVSPWGRRSVRVSMGHVSTIPIITLSSDTNLKSFLKLLHESYHVQHYVTVCNSNHQDVHLLEKMDSIGNRWSIVLGSEGTGVSRDIIDECCIDKISIGMISGVDSLNVAVAAGILFHGLHERSIR